MNILLSGGEDGSFPFVIVPSRPGDSTFIFVLVQSPDVFAYFTFVERYSLR